MISGTKVGSRGTRPRGSARLGGDPAASGPCELAIPGHGHRYAMRGACFRRGRRGLGTSAWLPGGKEDSAEPCRQGRDRDHGHDGQLPRGKG